MARNSLDQMTRIYRDLTRGSHGFCREVETQCGYDITTDEIARIAGRAATAAEFHAIWENESWWRDAANEQADQ